MSLELLFSNSQYVKVPFEDFLEAQKRLGSKYIDLVLQVPHIYVDSTKVIGKEALKARLNEEGLKVISVTALPYRYSISADPETLQGAKTLDYYRRCIETTKYLEGKYLCLTGAGAPYDIDTKALMENAKSNLSLLAEYGETVGITILLGACFGRECPVNSQGPILTHVDEIAALVNDVNSPYLGAYLDTELASISGETIGEWGRLLRSDSAEENKLKLIRFTDGNYNGYRTWGRGCYPGEKYLKEILSIGYKGPISLQIPGERYADNPAEQDKENREKVQGLFEKCLKEYESAGEN